MVYKLLTDDDDIQCVYTELYNYVSSLLLRRAKDKDFVFTLSTIPREEWQISSMVHWKFFPITKESYEFYSSTQKSVQSCSTLADNDLYDLLNILEV